MAVISQGVVGIDVSHLALDLTDRRLRDRAVRLPALRQDTFKRAAREVDKGKQAALDL